MYLEISPRQVGKTKRMCEAIDQYVSGGGTAYVQTHSEQWYKQLLFGCKNRGDKKIIRVRNQRHIEELERGCKPSRNIRHNPRIFADEFDMIEDDVVLNPRGYYCTTAKYMRSDKDMVLWLLGKRKDVLLDAIEMNGGKYDTYSPTSLFLNRSINDIKAMRSAMTEDQYKNEIMGNVWT